jgi:hypothetical protein
MCKNICHLGGCRSETDEECTCWCNCKETDPSYWSRVTIEPCSDADRALGVERMNRVEEKNRSENEQIS